MTILTDGEKLRRKEQRKLEKWNSTHKIINGIDHKKCSICEEYLPATNEYFYSNKSNGIDGLNPYCRDCTSKKSHTWIVENREKFNENFKKYSSKDHVKKRRRKRSEKQRLEGQQKEWQQNNKDKLTKYRLSRSNKNHDITDGEWNSCKEYFNNECAYCGLHISEHFIIYGGKLKWTDLHREHVIHEGAGDLSNCIPSCRDCNSQKWEFQLEEWYNENNKNFDSNKLNKIHKWLEEDYIKFKE